MLLRVDVPTDAALRRLIQEPLAPGIRGSAPKRTVSHDLYHDTPDALLEQSGVTCRVRTDERGHRTITVEEHSPLSGVGGVPDATHEDAVHAHGDAWRDEDNGAMRRLRSLVAPADLIPRLEVKTERHIRSAPTGLLRHPSVECEFLCATVRADGHVGTFREAVLRPLVETDALASVIGMHWELRFPILASDTTPLARARKVAQRLHAEATAARVGVEMATVLALADRGRIACVRDARGLRLPSRDGCGEHAADELALEHGADPSSLAMIGRTTPGVGRACIEVWLAARGAAAGSPSSPHVVWAPVGDLLARAGDPLVSDARTLAALSLVAEAPQAAELLTGSEPHPPILFEDVPPDPPTLDAELSLIEFNARVLTMAEDEEAIIGDRLRMLAITCANIDEFVMVRLADLRARSAEPRATGDASAVLPSARLDAARARLAALEWRQARCLDRCLDVLAARGTRSRSWDELDASRQGELREWFAAEIAPRITTGGMTLILGHPFPRLPSLTPSVCVVGRSRVSGQWRFAQFDLPRDVRRFIDVPGTTDVIRAESVARGCADLLYPDLEVVAAYVFRVLREGDLDLSEQGDLFDRVEEGTRRRGFNHIVRIEVEHAMPNPVRETLLATFQVEPGIADNALTSADVHGAFGLLAMVDVRELVARAPTTPLARGAPAAVAPLSSVWMEIGTRDRVFHHPYVAYDATVLRFLAAAASDPQVRAISMTLYRVGDPSPVVDTLLAARAAGKDVSAYVELTARFDETRNLSWVERLEAGGVAVSYGRGDLKCHAKVALVERQEGGALRRYAHVGTGNYNAFSARMYTDFSLLTADPRITDDLRRFFDWLPAEPRGELACEHMLVAPAALLPGLLARIDREIAHAGAGRPARIRLKLNALSEDDLVGALYRASSAGVEIDLVVRGICTLRPGVRGLSDRIRVSSRIGRYLEHGRIYHFANGGDDEYFIGSADWRPRNMRRRIEIAVPILDPDARALLGQILDAEISDPARWRLEPDGRYRAPVAGTGIPADERFASR